ncbi:DUF1345 domain-containing protein [Streptosporangium sp. 'caverna']|uniref:DUF1345 domain-containing protein n=1 Tax=Streptosporangium sp. 'caverna' TaxID=2202249 RepID=UPI0013A6B8F8|nr:DUF1345 domain-containing protein [Streptosporangium sp. 'caverna']
MRWWYRESSRQLLAVPPVFLCLLVPGGRLVQSLAAWDIFAVVYLLLTWFTLRGREPSTLRAIALAPGRREFRGSGLVLKPEQLAQSAAFFALLATVWAMPQARDFGTSPILVLTVCALAVVTSWLTLQIGFVIAYLRTYAETGGITFPGDDEPGLVDFLYFAVSVGTTFGTTDVTVTQSRMRGQVLAHGIFAFIFNTLILAVAITIVTSYIAGS